MRTVKTEYFWTAKNEDGEILNLECENQSDVEDFMQEAFEEKCLDEERAGFQEESFALLRYYFDDNGEKIFVEEIPSGVEFENIDPYKEHRSY